MLFILIINLGILFEGLLFKDKFLCVYEYLDCWIEDSCFVVLNVWDVWEKGVDICVWIKVVLVECVDDCW